MPKNLSAISPEAFGQLQPRYIGPIGNRASAVVGVPGDPLVYYAGAASGGIFKTTDGGTHWQSIFDGQAAALDDKVPPAKVSSIGALAVSESNPNVVWAGTGESWIRGPISIGNGVYKSVDGGGSWTHMGLEESGRVSKIVTHPTNLDVAWVAVLGSCYAPSPWRGVFKTTDGGLSWRPSLHVDEDTGCSDLVIDPSNPAVLYAGMWQFNMRSWIRVSGGPGSGLYKSVDGGESWVELTSGLPTEGGKHVVGKISVGVAGSDSSFVYANIETGDGEPTWDFPNPGNGQLFQSTDAGASWTVKSYNRSINSRAAYYTRNVVSPDNRNEVYIFGPELVVTTDGGDTLTTLGYPQAPGVDHHAGWIDPTNGDRIAVASDSGISISQNRGDTWYKIQLPISQIYQVSVDDRIPYDVYGNCQDRIATWGPSNARIPYSQGQGDLGTGPIPRGLWVAAASGECGYTIPDPKDPDLLWSSGGSSGPNGGSIALINRRTGHWRMVTVRPGFQIGTAPKDLEHRFHWHHPLAVSPHDDLAEPDRPRRVYAGSQCVHVTQDYGQSWRTISPELTGRDEHFLQSSGGITGDNIGVRLGYTTSAIAESPSEPGLLWVGTGDQRVWIGRLQGDEWAWEEVTEHIGGLPRYDESDHPDWGLVSCLAPSRHAAGTAYVSFDFHQANDPKPYIYKTTNHGKTWTPIAHGIPHSVASYVHWIAEDTICPELLFLGTENALYVSFDGGGGWQALPGLPPAPVSGMVVQERFSDLVISTFGRGFWIYDEISPLRELAVASQQEVHLFTSSRPIYRFQFVAEAYGVPHDNDPTIGIDPPSPAPIDFYLSAPAKSATLEVLDESGEEVQTVRTITVPKTVSGINRVWWDLQSDASRTIELRTNPPNQKGTQYCPSGVRPFNNPVDGNSLSWLVPPGKYMLRLEVETGSETVCRIREIEILKDPTSTGSLDDIALQHALSKKIWSDLSTVAGDINVIEFICFQIEQLGEWLENREALDLLAHLERDLREVEDRLVQRKITGEGEDLARFPARLVSNLVNLGGLVGQGDYPPTDQQQALFDRLHSEVVEQNGRLEGLVEAVELEVNPALRELGVPTLLVVPPKAELCGLFETGPAF